MIELSRRQTPYVLDVLLDYDYQLLSYPMFYNAQ